MNTRSGILAGGNWIVDKVKFVDVYPRQDALANILAESMGNGGSPFNLLVGLAKLGAKFPLEGVGLIGVDAEGEWICRQCREHGIDASRLAAHATVPTSYTDVMTVKSSGRRTFFHQRGANAHLDASSFDFARTNARIFHLGYLLLLDRMDAPDPDYGTAAARVLHAAREAGCKTSVDVVSEDSRRFAGIVRPALPHVDYCIMNEFEIERTTDIETRPGGSIDLAAVEKAACRLREFGVREWIVVHFPEGACALGAEGGLHVQGSVAVPREEVVSTVGAGDAFAAGLLHGLHEELDIGRALRQGVCVAAASLRGACCSSGILPLDECLALGEKRGFHLLG